MTESDVYYKVIWTRERKLSVACMQWFDEDGYNEASTTKFESELAAVEYALKLAKEHEIETDIDFEMPYPILDGTT